MWSVQTVTVKSRFGELGSEFNRVVCIDVQADADRRCD
jgi:hypothetical protein